MASATPTLGGNGPLLLGVTWAEAFIATVLFVLRAHSAAFTNKATARYQIFGVRWDFIWVTIAYVCAMTAQSFITVSVLYGTGNHEAALSYPTLVVGNLWSWIGQIMAITGTTISRIAVIAFLLSVQGQMHPKLKWVLYAVGFSSAAINAIEIILIMRQCDPVNKLWDPMVPGTCAGIEVCSQVGFLQGSIGATSDLVLALYPIFIVGQLQKMRTMLKIGLCIIMGGGVFACVAGINKTIAIHLITETSDITFAIFGLLAWVFTEMWFIIIFGSIPAIRPVFKRIAQKARSMVSRSGTSPGLASSQSHRSRSGRARQRSGNRVQIRSTADGAVGAAGAESRDYESDGDFELGSTGGVRSGSRFKPYGARRSNRDFDLEKELGMVGVAKSGGSGGSTSNESEEAILPAQGQIVITMDTKVHSEPV